MVCRGQFDGNFVGLVYDKAATAERTMPAPEWRDVTAAIDF